MEAMHLGTVIFSSSHPFFRVCQFAGQDLTCLFPVHLSGSQDACSLSFSLAALPPQGRGSQGLEPHVVIRHFRLWRSVYCFYDACAGSHLGTCPSAWNVLLPLPCLLVRPLLIFQDTLSSCPQAHMTISMSAVSLQTRPASKQHLCPHSSLAQSKLLPAD